MKKHTISALIAVGLFPAIGFSQTTPAPTATPSPAAPTASPSPTPDSEKKSEPAKVSVTYLGVTTSAVPAVVAEQLGLPKGFGLVVDYVVPNGPAASAGVERNDILRLFNDQILTEPSQLSKLIRSNAEGTNVVLTILRKGNETKLNVRLGKKEVPERRHRHWGGFGHWEGDFEKQMEQLGEELGQMDFGMFDGAEVREIREEARREAREAAREAQREAREASREAARAAREAARQFRISRRENGGLKTTRIDMDRAQIVYHDDKGELKLENVAGKKILTAKSSEGVTLFSGPVDTDEDLQKLPPEVRERFQKLEQKDLPSLAPPSPSAPPVPPVPAVPPVPPVSAPDRPNAPAPEEQGNDMSEVVLQARCPGSRAADYAAPASSNFELNIVLI